MGQNKFWEFLDIKREDDVSGAKIIREYKEALAKSGIGDKLIVRFKEYFYSIGSVVNERRMKDACLVAAPMKL